MVRKLSALTFTIIALFTIIICSLMVVNARADQIDDSSVPQGYYSCVQLAEGDTLESIATEYNNSDFYSNQEYIDCIKRINNLNHDNLHPGCYLTVVCY